MDNNRHHITFVLPPGFNFSGGARVTVEMANHLLVYGNKTRIIYKRTTLFSLKSLKISLKHITIFFQQFFNKKKNNWLKDFKGNLESYTHINNVNFTEGEFVIAVGLMTVQDVSRLNKNVYKIRYCHGMQEQNPQLMKQAWLPDMNTIAVSRQLIPRIKQLTKNTHIEIIPNGIDFRDYFVEHRLRDGIGTIYSRNKIKNPVFIEQIMSSVRDKIPEASQYLFGIDKKPNNYHGYYSRFPTIAKARELYNRCKIWIIASRSEGFSLPILEAMACGCAVISTEHQGSVELIQHGHNGFIVPVDDLPALIDYIHLLWNNDQKRLFIVNNSLATVKEYNWETAVKKMINFLIKCKNDVEEPEKN